MAKDESKPEYVEGNERKPIARPQPPMKDRRTKRARTRAAQEQAARKDQE